MSKRVSNWWSAGSSGSVRKLHPRESVVKARRWGKREGRRARRGTARARYATRSESRLLGENLRGSCGSGHVFRQRPEGALELNQADAYQEIPHLAADVGAGDVFGFIHQNINKLIKEVKKCLRLMC